jgi:hypothetical protein
LAPPGLDEVSAAATCVSPGVVVTSPQLADANAINAAPSPNVIPRVVVMWFPFSARIGRQFCPQRKQTNVHIDSSFETPVGSVHHDSRIARLLRQSRW